MLSEECDTLFRFGLVFRCMNLESLMSRVVVLFLVK